MWGAWGEPRLSNSDVSCACTTQLADRAVCRCSGWVDCRIMSASMKLTLTYLPAPPCQPPRAFCRSVRCPSALYLLPACPLTTSQQLRCHTSMPADLSTTQPLLLLTLS